MLYNDRLSILKLGLVALTGKSKRCLDGPENDVMCYS